MANRLLIKPSEAVNDSAPLAINLPGGGSEKGRWGREILWARGNLHDCPFQRSTPSALAHNGKRRLHPQHSMVSPQRHDADHEAFLSLGCALICWQSLRRGG